MKLQWVARRQVSRETVELYGGRWKIGSIHLDGSVKPGQPPYSARIILSGLNPDQGHFPDLDSAKEHLIRMLGVWHKGLNEKPDLKRSLSR